MTTVILPDPLEFEWDSGNKNKIRLRHNINPAETEQTFKNQHIIKFDANHSHIEQRYQLIGMNDSWTILFVVFTIRNNKIRVISARMASRKERQHYVKEI